MRLVKVTAPKGKGADVAKLAFECGIPDVSIYPVEQHKRDAQVELKEAVDMHVPTPHGRALVEALVRAPFYSRDQYSIDIREPRSVLRNTSVREMTRPISAPLLDIDQELWQFSHVTYSYVLRVFIAAVLLAYGMIRDNPLPMIGGLAFLPFTPLVLGLAFGIFTRQPKLVVQTIVAFIAGVVLLPPAEPLLRHLPIRRSCSTSSHRLRPACSFRSRSVLRPP